ncbi:phosphonate ABC transporter substrate-binding protein [Rhizobium binae]|uniref:Phosphonate transport system substrate-binding protein n=1 Tax=Rhizobium binae TaxID=1138190 RepID=A0ABV2MJG1_9HYPH|nr:phosphonate ABC transporter substrate-binding protein [Rhizobium binae]NKL48054.1 phosphonate ABC transporter substrate-binding protein [Rhizobium leguminosarum bv. viciae]MBX4929427.1 phosphonate ABC transporter substrate-binding protein [Rhizobium binae]MBX4940256.1 phosphonate ABC transporter substrate-binding protein [Rhizobium binae]MBX4946775.1 phosphonate ABC transporter substrate-binding protein [Rhizobium binae]MBX4952894.1 phosphonate ABC transporter substrate-binding protein [Rhi
MLKKALFAATALFALAGAANAADLKEFRIGILGGENEADRLRNYACLQEDLKKEFGFEKVSLFPAADYDGVIQGLLGGTLDFAELGASGYAATYIKDANAVTPILTTKQTDGATGYYSVLIARKDSGFKTLADSKGKKLGYADPDSTSGYLIPKVTLPKDLGMPVDQFYSSTSFNGGHENNVLAVLDKKVDVGVTWASGVGDFKDGYTSGNLRKMVDKGTLNMNDVVQLWQSPLIPNGPIVVSNKLGDEWKGKLADFFMALPEKDKKCFEAIEGGEYAGYVKVTPEFYNAVIETRRATIGG